MKTHAGLKEILSAHIEDETIANETTLYLNIGVDRAATLTDWAALKYQKDITPDSDGVVIPPARFDRVRQIVPAVSGVPSFEFDFTRELPTANQHRLNRYWCVPYSPSLSNELAVSVVTVAGSQDVVAASGETSFFDATHEGRELRIAGFDKEFEIISFVEGDTDKITVYPAPGKAVSSAQAVVGPAERERWRLLQPSLAAYTGEVTFHYQTKHPTLVSNNDRLLIPCPYSVCYLALELCLQQNKYNVDADRLAPRLMELKNEELQASPFAKTKSVRRNSLFSRRSNGR